MADHDSGAQPEPHDPRSWVYRRTKTGEVTELSLRFAERGVHVDAGGGVDSDGEEPAALGEAHGSIVRAR